MPLSESGSGAGRARSGRVVGALELLALGINGIIGVGIFFAPADIARDAPGAACVAVFVVTAILLVPVAVAQAKLGGVFDEDGGPVLFAREAFGPLASFGVGWVTYVSSVFSTAAIVAGLAHAVSESRAAPFALAAALAVACVGQLRVSARVWSVLTVAKLLPLAALVVVGLVALGDGRLPALASSTAAPHPRWLHAALTAVFVYQGFEIVPVLAGHVARPERAIPRAVLGSLGVAALVYVSLMVVAVRAVPSLATSAAPLADGARALGGTRLARCVEIGTSVSALGISFGMMVMTPRYLMAVAQGDALPLGLDRVGPGGVPRRALAFTWGAVTIVLALGDRAELFSLSSLAVVLQYALAAAALGRLALARRRGLTPRDAWPVVPSLLVGLLLLGGAERKEWSVAVGALLVGAALHGAWRATRRVST